MKFSYYLLFAFFLIITACSDEPDFSELIGEKDEKVAQNQDIKMSFERISDVKVPFLNCGFASAGCVKGHCTLLGNVIPEKSLWMVRNWHWDKNSKDLKLIENVKGAISGASGDSYYYTGTIITNMTDMSLTGYISIKSGTGRMAGITGECSMTGSAVNKVSVWTINGSVTLPGK